MATPVRRTVGAVLAVALTLATAPAAHAQLRDGFRGTLAPRGDDTITPFVNFGFGVNIRGGIYSSASACMNGYLSLGVPIDPGACLYAGQTTSLATLPQFADVYGTAVVGVFRDLNSSPATSGQLGYGAGSVVGRQAFGFTWNGVFTFGTTTPNFLQLVFIDRSGEFGAGAFDLEYNYGALAAAGGVGGLSDDGGFSGAAYTAAVTPAANSRITQCYRSGTALGAVPCASQTLVDVVPEPATVLLTVVGLGALAGVGASRRRAA